MNLDEAYDILEEKRKEAYQQSKKAFTDVEDVNEFSRQAAHIKRVLYTARAETLKEVLRILDEVDE